VTPSIAEAAASAEGAFLGFRTEDLPLIVPLPFLIMLSGCMSASETTLFGLSTRQRLLLRERSVTGRIVDTLLADQRQLLITILLANTTVNVSYFVLSSVAMMRCTAPPPIQAIIGTVMLLVLILCGEVIPKVLADAARLRLAPLLSPPLLALHRGLTPVRFLLSDVIIAPLVRLVSPARAPEKLSENELESLIALSTKEGALDPDEQRVLRELVSLRRIKVRSVMTPRVRMPALSAEASRDEVMTVIAATGRQEIPVHGDGADEIRGFLNVKRFLSAPDSCAITDPRVMNPPSYVPEIASLEQLLEFFRARHTRSAIAVDEYGGTEGLVTIDDLLHEVVGETSDSLGAMAEPRLIGLGTWQVTGDEQLRDWARLLGVDIDEARISTLSGYVIDQLGRAPMPGDRIETPKAEIVVERVNKQWVASALVRLRSLGAEPS